MSSLGAHTHRWGAMTGAPVVGYTSLRDRLASPRHCETERPETETRPKPKTVEAVTRPRPRKSGLENYKSTPEVPTAGKMRNLVVFVVILQLSITAIDTLDEFQFGDIIAFPRKPYQHYAVWVGDENFEGKEPGENIFEYQSRCS
ncbi:hypothetical protein N1851_028047 [Merluccius polli]|uniref:Uncharacterized protein n=1 Tax=Merluccius polli TaxID=89951 RepID=A0AA47M9E1_MERPO|nr:hypothetical protein N1851_028047 [Merluccius polli]